MKSQVLLFFALATLLPIQSHADFEQLDMRYFSESGARFFRDEIQPNLRDRSGREASHVSKVFYNIKARSHPDDSSLTDNDLMLIESFYQGPLTGRLFQNQLRFLEALSQSPFQANSFSHFISIAHGIFLKNLEPILSYRGSPTWQACWLEGLKTLEDNISVRPPRKLENLASLYLSRTHRFDRALQNCLKLSEGEEFNTSALRVIFKRLAFEFPSDRDVLGQFLISIPLLPRFAPEPFPVHLHGGNSLQDQVLIETRLAILKGSQFLAQSPSLLEALDFFAERRYSLAQAIHQQSPVEDVSSFGILRSTSAHTPIVSAYTVVKNEAVKLAGKGFFQIQYTSASQERSARSAATESPLENSQTYLLTKISCHFFPEYFEYRCSWNHTSPEVAQRFIENEASPIFHKILHTEFLDDASLYEELGRLHWMLAHAMLYSRGSAWIGENLIRSILVLKGKPILPFRVNTLPDLQALVEPDIEVYAQKYFSFFDPTY